jgi:hypothetical protein
MLGYIFDPDGIVDSECGLDTLNRQLREVYFGGGGGQGPYNDALLVTTADGKMLLHN